MSRAVFVVAFGACASSDPRIGTSTPLVALDQTGQRLVVSGDVAYDLHFAVAGTQMPDELNVGGVNAIGTRDPGDTESETAVGLAVFPAVTVAAGVGSGSSMFSLDFVGPAIARARVQWAIPYTCAGSGAGAGAHVAQGVSLFTTYPTGRIVRSDTITPTDSAIDQAAQPCGAQIDNSDVDPPVEFFVTSFWTFPGAFEPIGSDDADLRAGSPSNSESVACGVGDAAIVGLAWPAPDTRFHPRGTNAFVFDWLGRDGSATLPAASDSVTTTMLVAPIPSHQPAPACSDFASPLVAPPPAFTVSDGAGTLGSASPRALDGVYVSDTGGGSELRAASYTLTTQAMVPGGFAISLDLDTSEHARVSRDGNVVTEDDGSYRTQRDGSNSEVIFWFHDGLGSGQIIQIEPY